MWLYTEEYRNSMEHSVGLACAEGRDIVAMGGQEGAHHGGQPFYEWIVGIKAELE